MASCETTITRAKNARDFPRDLPIIRKILPWERLTEEAAIAQCPSDLRALFEASIVAAKTEDERFRAQEQCNRPVRGCGS